MLDAGDRNSWMVYAANTPTTNKLGATVHLSGQQWYIRSFIASITAGLVGGIGTAPTVFDTGVPVIDVNADGTTSPTEIQLGIGEGSLLSDFRLEGDGASSAGILRVFLGPPINPGRYYWKGPYQHAVNLPVVADDTVIAWATTQTSLLNDNGALADGQRRPIKADILYDDGRLSQPWTAVANVTVASA